MLEPVALSDFFLSFFSAALTVLLAALYAGLFTWEKITANRVLRYWTWLVYGLLLLCIAVFAQVYHLSGHWQILVFMMALGYWWMPRLIWRLCVATHDE